MDLNFMELLAFFIKISIVKNASSSFRIRCRMSAYQTGGFVKCK